MATEERERPEEERDGLPEEHEGFEGTQKGENDEDLFVLDLDAEDPVDLTPEAARASEAEVFGTGDAADDGVDEDDLFLLDGEEEAEEDSLLVGDDELEFVIDGDEAGQDEASFEDELFNDIDVASEEIVAQTADLGPGGDEEISDELLSVSSDDFVLVDNTQGFEDEEPVSPMESELAGDDDTRLDAGSFEPLEIPDDPIVAQQPLEPAPLDIEDEFEIHDEVSGDEPLGLDLEEAEPPHMKSSGTWHAVEQDDEFTLVDDDEDLRSGIMSGIERAIRPADEYDTYDDHDPIYGQQAEEVSLEDHPVFQVEEPDYKQLEPIVQEHDSRQVVVAPLPAERRVWMRRLMAASMAASVLILGIVAFVTLRPDLPLAKRIRGFLGLEVDKRATVEVAVLERPRIVTDVHLPGVEITEEMRLALAEPTKSGGPDKGPGAGGEVSPESRKKFEQLMAGLDKAGGLAKTLAKTFLRRRGKPAVPEKGPQPPVRPNVPTGPVARKDPVERRDPEPVETRPDPVEPVEPVARVRKGLRPMTAFSSGIARGTQAFAQLHNGNFFVGRVRKVIPEELILELGPTSEIAFVPGDLQKLMPLAEAEARILKAGPDGYVRLKNKNKIWGKILEDLPDVVTIQSGQARIVVPKISIEEVSKERIAPIQLGKEEEDWSKEELPKVELQLPMPEAATDSDEELPQGAVRVDLGPVRKTTKTTPTKQAPMDSQDRSDGLKKTIRRKLPGVLPGSK